MERERAQSLHLHQRLIDKRRRKKRSAKGLKGAVFVVHKDGACYDFNLDMTTVTRMWWNW